MSAFYPLFPFASSPLYRPLKRETSDPDMFATFPRRGHRAEKRTRHFYNYDRTYTTPTHAFSATNPFSQTWADGFWIPRTGYDRQPPAQSMPRRYSREQEASRRRRAEESRMYTAQQEYYQGSPYESFHADMFAGESSERQTSVENDQHQQQKRASNVFDSSFAKCSPISLYDSCSKNSPLFSQRNEPFCYEASPELPKPDLYGSPLQAEKVTDIHHCSPNLAEEGIPSSPLVSPEEEEKPTKSPIHPVKQDPITIKARLWRSRTDRQAFEARDESDQLELPSMKTPRMEMDASPSILMTDHIPQQSIEINKAHCERCVGYTVRQHVLEGREAELQTKQAALAAECIRLAVERENVAQEQQALAQTQNKLRLDQAELNIKNMLLNDRERGLDFRSEEIEQEFAKLKRDTDAFCAEQAQANVKFNYFYDPFMGQTEFNAFEKFCRVNPAAGSEDFQRARKNPRQSFHSRTRRTRRHGFGGSFAMPEEMDAETLFEEFFNHTRGTSSWSYEEPHRFVPSGFPQGTSQRSKPVSAPFSFFGSCQTPSSKQMEVSQKFQEYKRLWNDLGPQDPNIPYPTSTLKAEGLSNRENIRAFLDRVDISLWGDSKVIEANIFIFYSLAFGFRPQFWLKQPFKPDVERGVNGKTPWFSSNLATLEEMKAFLRREKNRWHPDALGRRNGGTVGTNEELIKTAEGVFQAVQNLIELCQCENARGSF